MKPKAEADNLYWDSALATETLIILDITKTDVMFFLLHWRQATQSTQTWYEYPYKSFTAGIHDMITHDLECPWHDYCIIYS